MKRLMLAGIFVVLVAVNAGAAAAAPDDYDDTQSHPLRVIAYCVYPLGYTAEWIVFRPFHYLVSRSQLENIFGHHEHGGNRIY